MEEKDVKTPSILSLLRAWDGRSDFELPDEECGENTIRFASGAMDGIAAHHMTSAEPTEAPEVVDDLIAALERLVRERSDDARAALYELALREDAAAAGLADALIERIVER